MFRNRFLQKRAKVELVQTTPKTIPNVAAKRLGKTTGANAPVHVFVALNSVVTAQGIAPMRPRAKVAAVAEHDILPLRVAHTILAATCSSHGNIITRAVA